MTGNSDSGDGEALPERNSDLVRLFLQYSKEAADLYQRRCQLVLEAEKTLSAEAFQQFIDRLTEPKGK
jgi:hypothetical protein